MRIGESSNRQSYKWVKPLAGLVLLCGLIYAAVSFWPSPTLQADYSCGAENFQDGVFKTKNADWSTNCKQNKAVSNSGSASCECSGDKRFGPTLSLEGLKFGDTLKISIYTKAEKSKSRIVLSSSKEHYVDFPIASSKKWLQSTFDYTIPPDGGDTQWKLYPYLIEGQAAYYDDITVKVASLDSTKEVSYYKLPHFELQINDQNFNKISKKREEAMQRGLLFSSKEDLVVADIRVDGVEYDCKVRLKGDLLDHLQGDKWSFRVMLDNDEKWADMNIFSIHNSKARSHLAEWFMHHLMKKEGILSPKYDFINFSLNKKYVGTYGYEQHFDNHFLTENKRLIGPIIRHNDEGFWDNISSGLKDYEWVASSQIELFNKENEGKASFDQLYQYGHSQLYHYLKSKKEASEVFDLDKMAKYYALIEVGHGVHAQQVTNIRFYVDPMSGLLEPIGFDFYGDYLPNVSEHWRPVGMWENGKKIHERSREGDLYQRMLFSDLKFFEKYMFYLDKYSSPNYLKNEQERLQSEIDIRTSYVGQDPDYKGYKFDLNKVFAKAKFTRAKIKPLAGVSLVSYRTNNRHEVQLQNFHYFPLSVVGYVTKAEELNLAKPIVLEPYSPNSEITTYSFVGEKKPLSVKYKVLGLDEEYVIKINNDLSPVTDVESGRSSHVDLASHPQIKNEKNILTIKSRELVIDKSYIVNESSTFAISDGSTLKFVGNGSLTIYGNITAIGTASAPIYFLGSKNIGQGVLIKSKRDNNIFENVIFTKLGSYKSGIIDLESSVNIHDCKVDFTGCSWTNNDAKVNLKLTNTEYQLVNCEFSNSSGDAISSVFSVGNIEKVSARNFGRNFATTIGGSLKGENVKLDKILGWGISASQFSFINIAGYVISDSNNSVSASGMSEIYIGNYKGKASNVDLEALSSKGGKTRVTVKGVPSGIKLKYVTSPESILYINGVRKYTK